MKVEINGNEIRIKGKNVGDKRHLVIYVSEKPGRDEYFISLVKDNFIHSCGPRFFMDDEHVIRDKVIIG